MIRLLNQQNWLKHLLRNIIAGTTDTIDLVYTVRAGTSVGILTHIWNKHQG